MAKNRLNKFYNPKMYQEAPKRELTEEESITVSMGGTLAPTEAPGLISLVQVTRHRHRQQQPEADFSSKKSGESSGVIRMIDMLIADLDKDNTIMETEEKDAQSEYETFMADAKTKRSLDAKAITDKEGSKAAAEAEVETSKSSLKEKKTETVETDEYIMGLHQECDWLIKFYSTRKEARSDELEALDKAKSVLSGADYSFLQLSSTRSLRR